jgi:hypothetical protein
VSNHHDFEDHPMPELARLSLGKVRNTLRAAPVDEDAPARAETALAFAQKLGLTELELQAALACPVALDEAAAPRPASLELARAFPVEVVDALTAPRTAITLKAQHLRQLGPCARRARAASGLQTKLRAAVDAVERAAQADVAVLEAVSQAVLPQLAAQPGGGRGSPCAPLLELGQGQRTR